MLTREEYNMVFGHNLSQEEFDKITGLTIDESNMQDIASFTLVGKKTHKVVRLYQVITCRECKYRNAEYEWRGEYDCRKRHDPPGLDFFCADGQRKGGYPVKLIKDVYMSPDE